MTAILENLGVGIISGVISGMITGFMVYRVTKKREEKYEIYLFWKRFLFDSLKECEIDIPCEQLELIGKIGGKDSNWYKAIYTILDEMNPFGHENTEFTEGQEKIAESFKVAYQELETWRKKNRL